MVALLFFLVFTSICRYRKTFSQKRTKGTKGTITLYVPETFSAGAALVMGSPTKGNAGIHISANQQGSPYMPKISGMGATASLGFSMNFYQSSQYLHTCEKMLSALPESAVG
jgi:hypothetical protein